MNKNISITEPIYADVQDRLYAISEAYKEHFLEVSEIHKIWIGEYGNPGGLPILFLHGGPGGGCMPKVTQLLRDV